MTRYWIKITLGALLIFAGRDGHQLRRPEGRPHRPHRRRNGRSHHHSRFASPPSAWMASRLAGSANSSCSAPLRSRSPRRKSPCGSTAPRMPTGSRRARLRIDDVEKIDERTTFVCVTADNPGVAGAFERFGEVRVEGTDARAAAASPRRRRERFPQPGRRQRGCRGGSGGAGGRVRGGQPQSPPRPRCRRCPRRERLRRRAEVSHAGPARYTPFSARPGPWGGRCASPTLSHGITHAAERRPPPRHAPAGRAPAGGACRRRRRRRSPASRSSRARRCRCRPATPSA